MIIHKDLIQGTDEWKQARIGKLTASYSSTIMAKQGLGKGAETLAVEIIAEQLTGEPLDNYTSKPMEDGSENELYARDIYADSRCVSVEEIGGFEDVMLWMSPDGLVNKDGLIEIKCCQPKRHIQNILFQKYRNEYNHQMQFGLMISERQWCDLVLFNPDMPDNLKAKVFRIERDEEYIKLIQDRIIQFKVMIDEFKKQLT